jgi:hypothetical protein
LAVTDLSKTLPAQVAPAPCARDSPSRKSERNPRVAPSSQNEPFGATSRRRLRVRGNASRGPAPGIASLDAQYEAGGSCSSVGHERRQARRVGGGRGFEPRQECRARCGRQRQHPRARGIPSRALPRRPVRPGEGRTAHWSSGMDSWFSARRRGFDSRMRYKCRVAPGAQQDRADIMILRRLARPWTVTVRALPEGRCDAVSSDEQPLGAGGVRLPGPRL